MMQVIELATPFLQARFYHGLADPLRMAILHALREREHTVSEAAEATGTSLSNASRHLTCLAGCGLVETRSEWRYTRYRLAPGVAELLASNEAFIETVAAHIAACHEPPMGRGKGELR